jgi:hypothetical protein
MNLIHRAASIKASPHTGRAVKVVRVLNLVGTVRGALATALLAMSAIGGAATVNTVREDIAHDRAAPRPTQTRAAPTATPLTASALRADMQKRLDGALAADLQAIDDLRKIAVTSGPRLDQLVADTKQKLQARYEQGRGQLDALLGAAAAPAPSTPTAAPTTLITDGLALYAPGDAQAAPPIDSSPSPTPSAPTTAPASPSIVAANALLQVITSDMNQIVVQATRAATTEPTPAPRQPTPPPATPAPTPSPRTTPPHTASPSPSSTARTPTPKPSPTR